MGLSAVRAKIRNGSLPRTDWDWTRLVVGAPDRGFDLCTTYISCRYGGGMPPGCADAYASPRLLCGLGASARHRETERPKEV